MLEHSVIVTKVANGSSTYTLIDHAPGCEKHNMFRGEDHYGMFMGTHGVMKSCGE